MSISRPSDQWPSLLRTVVILPVIGCVACSAIGASHPDPVPTTSVAASGSAKQKPLFASTQRIQSWCDRTGESCGIGGFYSPVLALPNGTVLASSMRDWEVGPLTVVRSDGVQCRASVKCTALFSHPSGTIWCLFVPEPATMTGDLAHGSQSSRVEVSYSNDFGDTWQVADLDPHAVLPGRPIGPTSAGFVFFEGNSQRLWTADAFSGGGSIGFRPVGSTAPGTPAGDVAFFETGRVCLQRSTQAEIASKDMLFCTQALDAGRSADLSREGPVDHLGVQEWRAEGPSDFFHAASGEHTWWAVDGSGRLLWSTTERLQWREVDGGHDFRAQMLSQQGDGGDLFAAGSRANSVYVVRVTRSGSIAQWLPVDGIGVTALGAEGGRIAIGALDGVYILDGTSWKRVIAGCGP